MPERSEREWEKPATILVAEDNQSVRDLARVILERRGFQVFLAADGQEALDISARHPGPIHLLLADMVMPQMSGPELARALEIKRPDMKVLFMSGYTEYALVNRGVMEKVQNFIWKPFHPEALSEKVLEVLSAEREQA